MNQTILVSIKNVYGRDMVYPANDNADLLLRLTGKKTFDNRDISIIKDLGYSVQVETPVLV